MARGREEVAWAFFNMDTADQLRPPYPVDDSGVRFSAGGVYSDQARHGSQDPITHWTAGRLRTLGFSTVLFSEDSTDVIEGEMDRFVALSEKIEEIGRPPICIFTYGITLRELVMVENVDVEIGQLMKTEMAVSRARQIKLSFLLRRYRPFSQLQIDPTKPAKQSYYLIVSRAEASYEAIARRLYGDPLRGDRLRKRHPEMPFTPDVGSKISCPPKSVLLRETVEPEFHALSPTDEAAAAAFEEILQARAKRTVIL